MQCRVLWIGLIGLVLAACASLQPCPESPPAAAPIPTTEISSVLFLIGDAGEARPEGEPVLAALSTAVAAAVETHGVERVAAVFLGDNVYPSGIPAPTSSGYPRARQRLLAEVAVFDPLRQDGVAPPARPVGLFVPGNHDWEHDRIDGVERIRRQAALLASEGGGFTALLPANGCPGPTVVDVGERLRLVLLDSHWWIRVAIKPAGEESGCAAGSTDEVQQLLAEALASAGPRWVVVAAHHPLRSGGPHSGARNPLIRLGLIPQDLPSRLYGRYIAGLSEVFAAHPPLVHAAGHDHSLQLLEGVGARYQIVSGTGSSAALTPVTALPETRFCRSENGFFRLDMAHDGRTRLAAVTVPGVEVFSTYLD